MSSSTLPSPPTSRKRSLILRDGLVFLALCGVTIALFLVTLLLFRSFENHREVLGKRWANRGETALREGRPAEAVVALRTALSYRDDLPAQLLLAQALASAGHTEEAANYFLNLRETRPGDGFINLQLARLYRREGDAQLSINDYRASIFGNWEGDGALRRRAVRFELAEYLAQRGERSAARDELLVAAGNAPDTAASDALFGDHLEAIGDDPDAFSFFSKAAALRPHDRETLARAGRLAYALGQYDTAARLLTGALEVRPDHASRSHQQQEPQGQESQAQGEQGLAALAASARRIPELNLSRDLPATERAEHLLVAARIAQDRLGGCLASKIPIAPGVRRADVAETAAPAKPDAAALTAPAAPPVLLFLRSRWLAVAPQLNKRALERDATLEDNIMQAINDTETETVAPCGAPGGDDALLLRLATAPRPAHP